MLRLISPLIEEMVNSINQMLVAFSDIWPKAGSNAQITIGAEPVLGLNGKAVTALSGSAGRRRRD